jgi:hypothetical protein
MHNQETKKGIFESENYEQDMAELRKLAEKIKEHTIQEQNQWKQLSLENS